MPAPGAHPYPHEINRHGRDQPAKTGAARGFPDFTQVLPAQGNVMKKALITTPSRNFQYFFSQFVMG